MAANPAVITNKAKLHVEVEIKREDDTDFVRLDRVRDAVASWIANNFVQLKVGQELTDDSLELELSLGCVIQAINIVDYDGTDTDESYHLVNNVQLDVQAFELREGGAEDVTTSGNDEDSPQLKVTCLPNKSLHGLYESLVFQEQLPSRLLRVSTKMMQLVQHPKLNPALVFWNHLILLHGPPGSGKTTLATALAQKLSIRLGNHYSKSRFVQVNSHTLMSKYFGESSKMVGKMFDTIIAMTEDETTLTIVLIDEVETLASCRQKAANGNECGDAIRVTNQVLTALDRFRYRNNAVVICTSNLYESLDKAFTDRVDLEKPIPAPNAECVYEFFRSSLNEMIRCNMVVIQPSADDNFTILHDTAAYQASMALCPNTSNDCHHADGICFELMNGSYAMDADEADDGSAPGPPPNSLSSSPSGSPFEQLSMSSSSVSSTLLDESLIECMDAIPELAYVNLKLWNRPKSTPRKLLRIAHKAQGMSGRTLRRLPFLALAEHVVVQPCSVQEALAALSRAVDEEITKHNTELFGEPRETIPDFGLM